jgi:hypothetical protein
VVGAAGRIDTCCEGSIRSGRLGSKLGGPARLGRQPAQAQRRCAVPALGGAFGAGAPRRRPPVQAHAGTDASAVRHHLPRRHLFSIGRIGARRSTTLPQPAPPPPPLTRAPQPVRAGRLLRRSTGAAPCAPRRCGRHAQAHAARPRLTLPPCSPPRPPCPPPALVSRPLLLVLAHGYALCRLTLHWHTRRTRSRTGAHTPEPTPHPR